MVVNSKPARPFGDVFPLAPRHGSHSGLVMRQVAIAVLAIVSGSAYAQTTPQPDAGSLTQQIEQGKEMRLPQVKKPTVAPVPETTPAGGLQVTVTRFRFVGNSRLGEAVLQQAVKPWLNRSIGFGELQKAAAAVAAAYRDAGWVVQAYLPKQEIDGGVVTIQVIEAVLGSVQVEGSDKVRTSQRMVRRMALAAQPAGQALNGDAIDRSLLVIDDLPGVSAQGFLKAGRNNGETDLVLQLEAEPLFAGNVGVDNTGSHSTGENRATLALYGNSLLGVGDLLTANAIHTKGSNYARLDFSAPVGYRGMRAGINHSQLRYRVTADEFDMLGLKGRSSSTGVDLSYPLVRSRLRNVYATVDYDHKTYFNQSNGVATSDYNVNVASVGLSGNMFDELWGGGSTWGGVTLSSGKLDLDASPNRETDAASVRSAGNFHILRYNVRRQQLILPKLTLTAGLTGQLANRNLDSSEKIYLGGVGDVRAYPASEAGGSEGNVVNLELRYALPNGFSVSSLYDWGRIRVNHDNDIAGAATRNDQVMKGAGLAVSWAAKNGASVRLTLARRIGTNPNANPRTGKDQDGTLDLNRVWLQANLPF